MSYLIVVPRNFQERKEEFKEFVAENDPEKLLERFSGRKLSSEVVIKHKPLEQAADFSGNTIFMDFRNDEKYAFLSVCHEMAHILLRQQPTWHSGKDIRDVLGKYPKKKVGPYKYSFKYAVEQTLATLLQAACENEAGLRKLEWKYWQDTFTALGIKPQGQVLFPEFKVYLRNREKYLTIDSWLPETLARYY